MTLLTAALCISIFSRVLIKRAYIASPTWLEYDLLSHHSLSCRDLKLGVQRTVRMPYGRKAKSTQQRCRSLKAVCAEACIEEARRNIPDLARAIDRFETRS